MTQVDFLRHGHCEGGEIFRGHTDVALSETGWQQLKDRVAGYESHWDVIVSSPLQRCRRFAEHLAEQTGTPLHVDERWMEMSFGDWDGKPVTEIWESDKASAIAYFSDPENNNTANVEPVDAIIARAKAAWDDLKEMHANKRVLVIAHGGIIRFHLATLLSLPVSSIGQLHLPYAALSRVVVGKGPLGLRETVHFVNGQMSNGD